jgi:peroxiredoxin
MKRKIILILFVFLLILSSGFKATASGGALRTIPGFSLMDFQGKKFTLSDELKNYKVILLWFTNLCKGCLEKIPEMEKIKKLYKEKGIEVVAISVLGDDRKTVEDVIQKKKVTFRFLFDPKGEIIQLFSGEHIPDTCPLKNLFIIDKDRKILFDGRYPGTAEDEIEYFLNRLTGGER